MPEAPDLRLDELKELAEQDDLHPFLARAPHIHPSDLADILSALDDVHRVRVISELPTELASSALAEMEATEHPEEMLLAVGPEYAAELVEEMPTDDAADLVAELSASDREAVLEEIRRDVGGRNGAGHLFHGRQFHPARNPAVTATPPLSLEHMRTDAVLEGLTRGDTAALARAISLVENQRAGFEQILSALHSRIGKSNAQRIGITGPPGAGKSTITEQLVRVYRERGLKVAVIAVDPTSPFTGGALLGDRIRMESVSLDPGVFIRSMATRGAQGGLATTTEEVADILAAFGFDRILIETVGVGQTELDVAATAETTVLVLVPESGDSIQTLKAGVMEIAELYVINKSDRPGADKLRQEIEVMLGIRRGNAFRHVQAHHGAAQGAGGRRGEAAAKGNGWDAPVLTTVASKGEGIADLVSALDRHHDYLVSSGTLDERRKRRLAARTRAVVNRAIRQWVWDETEAEHLLAKRLDDVAAGTCTPYDVAAEVLDQVRNGK